MTFADILSRIAGVVAAHGAFAVVGATARNAWAPPRATTDLDLAVVADADVLHALEAALDDLGYRCVRRQQAEPSDSLPDLLIFRSESAELRQVDLLVAKTPFEESALERAIPIDVAGTTVPVVSPEDLIVYKLLADRPRDRDDVRAVVRTQERAGRSLDWDYVERWAQFWGIEDRCLRLRGEAPDR